MCDNDGNYRVEELFHLYTYPSFIVYATFVVVVLVALWLAIRYFVKLQQEGLPRILPFPLFCGVIWFDAI